MSIQLIFETHSTTEDNELGLASGWKDCLLSATGRQQALQLGTRWRNDGIQAVFTSDLRRAIDTAEIAFAGTQIPIFHDWRLRECNYGDHNGLPAAEVHNPRIRYLDTPYPNGESWRQAVQRVGRFLEDLNLFWNDARVLVIGHRATHFGLDHHLKGLPLEGLLAAKFEWQEGWEYQIVNERETSDENTPIKKKQPRTIQGYRWSNYGNDASPWEYHLAFFTWLVSQNDAFLPQLQLMQAIVDSPFPAAGLYGLTSIHDILLGRSTDVAANPYLRISYSSKKKQFTLTYQDFTKEPWTHTCTSDEVWSVLERFLVKRARWFSKIHPLPNRGER